MILNIRIRDGQVMDYDQEYDSRYYVKLVVDSNMIPAGDPVQNYQWDGANFIRIKTQTLRTIAKTQITEADGIVLRAILEICLAEFNNHADKINAILNASDAATSLADFKTRMAAIADYPARTEAQLIAAIKAAIDSGTAD